ncbi:hypothetical protein SK128_022646 [Halocaridina rubra]|uniref:Glucose-methanol-choline oxidoreductase N-terminal domain-containing protein n=1 Tax=Halocaridina rubra TaxID=373956 RepID=A0AAN9AAS3_HALRR
MADAVRPTRWLLPTVLPIIRIMLTTFLREDQPTEEFNSPKYLYDRYDFIIVGGGTAGCVLASRLSEVAHWKILVLEAGGPPPPESRVPGLSRLFYFPSATTWHYNLAPQRHGLRAYNNRSSPVPHGRVIGGSSTVNGMVYARGSPRDFDHWASLGNPGWDYLSVLPYFKKSERYRGPKRPHTERFHGRRGPIPVTPESPGFFTRVFLQAGRYLGFKLIDPNGPDLMGFAGPDYTIYRGERWGPVRAYLEPAAKRPNLHILHSAHVLRIIFNKDKVAVGVIFMHHDKVKAVKANLEVILSAGAIASPKVLMLSGVGPQKHLHHHGIKVVHDLPGVGKNLQEHMCLYGLTWTVKPGVPNDVLNAANPASVTQYVHQKSGM